MAGKKHNYLNSLYTLYITNVDVERSCDHDAIDVIVNVGTVGKYTRRGFVSYSVFSRHKKKNTVDLVKLKSDILENKVKGHYQVMTFTDPSELNLHAKAKLNKEVLLSISDNDLREMLRQLDRVTLLEHHQDNNERRHI